MTSWNPEERLHEFKASNHGGFMFKTRFVALALTGVLLAGCASNGQMGDKQAGGTVLGALGGAAIGSAFGSGSGKLASVAAGAILGGLVGNAIGAQMDAEDRRQMEGAYYSAIASGTPARWRNDRTGNYGDVVVERPVYVRSGPVCRNYTNTVYIGGRPEIMRGQACRNPDGTWSPV